MGQIIKRLLVLFTYLLTLYPVSHYKLESPRGTRCTVVRDTAAVGDWEVRSGAVTEKLPTSAIISNSSAPHADVYDSTVARTQPL